MIPTRDDLPAVLVDAPRWLLWKREKRDGKWTKVPYRVDDPQRRASSTDPSTWSTFDRAVEVLPFTSCDGPGFVLGDGFVGGDLDKVIDEEGALDPLAQEILASLPPTYIERSPSERGLHIYVLGEIPAGSGKRQGNVELYGAGRYFTITGNRFRDAPLTLADGGDALRRLHERLGGDNGSAPPPHVDDDLVLDPKAEPPAAKLEALLAKSAKARATWEGTRKDIRDSSPSGFDMAMASIAARAGWSEQEIADLLIARRRGRGDALKLRNRQYYVRTIAEAMAGAQRNTPESEAGGGVELEDFYAYMPMHSYIFVPARDNWPAASVNARLPPIETTGADGKPEPIKASIWLDQHRAVEMMTWAPGLPMLVENRLISEGGWIERPGCSTFNLYRPPSIELGSAAAAGPWLEHIHVLYPEDEEHIIRWLAHRVQRPEEKINHALVLGGAQGIGKDTILEPVKQAVGPWNFSEVSPAHLLGRFNGFTKSVILRVSEARDLGDVDRFAFYDHMKIYTAAPPDVLRVDEKNIREYSVFNVCGVVITTNHKTDGIYLPADDRRHYVAWSSASIADFEDDYWTTLHGWYEQGGDRHVYSYLAGLDLSDFNPKAPPGKTPAFYDIVDANRAPEDAELADAIDALGNPPATTLSTIAAHAHENFGDWLRDRRNSRQIPHRLEEVGYVSVRNGVARDGKWKLGGRRQVIYARQGLSIRDRLAAAQALVEAGR